jgi:type I restriction enzyme, S subunit
MNLQTFFEKFELITDAPNALAKMRELVLNLAVQGKLVANTAENLLTVKQIALDKQQRLRELNLRSHPETPQPNENDFPFSLPKSWNAVSLGDLAYSCPTSYGEDPIPSLPKAGVVKVGNIDNKGGFKGQFSERGFPADEIESLLARRGDLMVVKSSGSAENVHSGKTALCTAEHDGKIVGTNFVLRLRLLGTPALPEYIWRVLTSRYSRAWIEGTVQTMTYPNLKWSEFARLPIPLPPLGEQKRIVAKVDELMALCDQLEAQQQEREIQHAALARASLARFADAPTQANLEFLFHKSYTITPADLRKSILALAVQGKLSVRSSDTTGWLSVTMKEVCELITDGEHATPQRVPSGIPLATAKNVRDGFLDMSQTDYVTSETAEKCWKRCKPKDQDILMVCVGATTGRVCLVTNPPDMVLVRSVALLRPNTKRIEATFLDLFLRSPSGQTQIWGGVRQNAQPCLYLGKMSEFTIKLAPLAEQRRIVAKVDQLMAFVDQLEAQLTASHATSKKLIEAVVAELASAA